MSDTDHVERVFDAWRTRQARPELVKLTPERRRIIAARLKTASPEDLLLVIEWVHESDDPRARFLRGGNREGRAYLGIDNLFRASKIDDRIEAARAWDDPGEDADPTGGDAEDSFGDLGALRSGEAKPVTGSLRSLRRRDEAR